MTKIKKITKENDKLALYTCKTHFVNGKLEEIDGTTIKRPDFDMVIKAIGSSAPKCDDSENIFYAGDCKNGGSTVVEAVASGKNVAQKIIEKF
jgi:NADPH-dependent glutamate synthase beta subunit-like oxidoreductase